MDDVAVQTIGAKAMTLGQGFRTIALQGHQECLYSKEALINQFNR